ncbi:uncharacterized protein Z518_08068 [Rhinocladiella mackenziei CBS 650.93]|uniref:BED-type domain-containing protein n=1 Tax=Rhinocladiella mackenziei CBS 650.93 TaxID=1442369 RepID=A0A0D2I8E0_9EURO|nr:uncharacterized protein Z518_08068 [Rhinocladiella mackenziei CBS 650.93]KIX02129.1 hypothetical protein Z518_08068 [Rhinocladiella mackenziei CBS 650.93]
MAHGVDDVVDYDPLPVRHPSSDPVYGLSGNDIVWTCLSGYLLVEKSSCTVQNRTGWTWGWGFDVHNQESGKKFWLCKICHIRKKQNTIFATEGTWNQQKHIIRVHHHDKDGSITRKSKRLTILDIYKFDANRVSEQRALNGVVSSFSAERFRELLLAWAVHDGIEFRKLESKHFKAMLGYAHAATTLPGVVSAL